MAGIGNAVGSKTLSAPRGTVGSGDGRRVLIAKSGPTRPVRLYGRHRTKVTLVAAVLCAVVEGTNSVARAQDALSTLEALETERKAAVARSRYFLDVGRKFYEDMKYVEARRNLNRAATLDPHNEEARELLDKVNDVLGDRYFYDGSDLSISDDHILGYAFEWGEEIEVSQAGDEWVKRLFTAYAPGDSYPIRTFINFLKQKPNGQGSFNYARPIRTPDLEITVKRDGKELTADELAKLTLEEIKEGLSHG